MQKESSCYLDLQLAPPSLVVQLRPSLLETVPLFASRKSILVIAWSDPEASPGNWIGIQWAPLSVERKSEA